MQNTCSMQIRANANKKKLPLAHLRHLGFQICPFFNSEHEGFWLTYFHSCQQYIWWPLCFVDYDTMITYSYYLSLPASYAAIAAILSSYTITYFKEYFFTAKRAAGLLGSTWYFGRTSSDIPGIFLHIEHFSESNLYAFCSSSVFLSAFPASIHLVSLVYIPLEGPGIYFYIITAYGNCMGAECTVSVAALPEHCHCHWTPERQMCNFKSFKNSIIVSCYC